MTKALLLENLHPVAIEKLENRGIEVETRGGALDEAELISALEGVDILGIRSKTNVTEAVLQSAPQLKAVGAFCIGTNQIELPAASATGVAVFNAPFSNTRSVVELAIGEIIALLRRLTGHNSSLHAGTWDKTAEGSHEIRGKVLGIIGYGNIGSQLSVVAEALGMSVIFYDTAEKLALGNAQQVGTLSELLQRSDIVTLHVDGRHGNAGFFGQPEFSQMKAGSIFLNLSRGFVVDYGALRDSISSGQIAGAAVDVFPTEPKKRGDSFDSELRGLSNVILTPHVGGSTLEAQKSIGEFVSNKILDFLYNGSTDLSVNLPAIALPALRTQTRFTYLHKNVPGVLAKINQELAKYEVNIAAQNLATRGEWGYVVTDVDSRALTPEAISALEDFPETIDLRILKKAVED